MSKFSMFPTLNSIGPLEDYFNITNNFEFTYNDNLNNTIKSLNPKILTDSTILKDSNHRWSPEFHNLYVRKKIVSTNQTLYGVNGIAPTGSIIGVATVFKSSRSLQRGILHNVIIDNSNSTFDFYMEYKFDVNQLRGDFTLETILYLNKSSSYISDEESHLNNIEGSILGVIYKHKFVLTGDSSLFPTKTIKSNRSALWEFKSGFSVEDMIEEGLMLEINESHKNYPLFDYKNKETYNGEFVKEVMISIVFQLIIKHKDEYVKYNEDEFQEGTIGSLIKFYIEAYNLDLSNNDKLYSQINRRIRK